MKIKTEINTNELFAGIGDKLRLELIGDLIYGSVDYLRFFKKLKKEMDKLEQDCKKYDS